MGNNGIEQCKLTLVHALCFIYFNNFHYVLEATSSSDGDLGSDNEGTGEQIIFINKNVEDFLCF